MITTTPVRPADTTRQGQRTTSATAEQPAPTGRVSIVRRRTSI